MRTRRSGGDNGYRSAEDFSNEGRGYEPRNTYSDLYRNERDDTDYRGLQNERGNTSNQYNQQRSGSGLRSNGSNQGSYDNYGSNWNNNNHRNDWNDHSRSGWNDNGANWGSDINRPQGNYNDYNNYSGRLQERGRDRNGYDNGSNMNDWNNDRNHYGSNNYENGNYGNSRSGSNYDQDRKRYGSSYGSSWEHDNMRNNRYNDSNRRNSDYMEDDNETYGGNRSRYGVNDEATMHNYSGRGYMSGSDRGYQDADNSQNYAGSNGRYNGNSHRSSKQGFGSQSKERKERTH